MKRDDVLKALFIWTKIERFQKSIPILKLIEYTTYLNKKEDKVLILGDSSIREFEVAHLIKIASSLLDGKTVFVSGRYARYLRKSIDNLLGQLLIPFKSYRHNATILRLDNGGRLLTFIRPDESKYRGEKIDEFYFLVYSEAGFMAAKSNLNYVDPKSNFNLILQKRFFYRKEDTLVRNLPNYFVE